MFETFPYFLITLLAIPAVIAFGNGASWWNITVPGLTPSCWTETTSFLTLRKLAFRASVAFSFVPFLLGLGLFTLLKGHEL